VNGRAARTSLSQPCRQKNRGASLSLFPATCCLSVLMVLLLEHVTHARACFLAKEFFKSFIALVTTTIQEVALRVMTNIQLYIPDLKEHFAKF